MTDERNPMSSTTPARRYRVAFHQGAPRTLEADGYARADGWVTFYRDAEPRDRLVVEYAEAIVHSIERLEPEAKTVNTIRVHLAREDPEREKGETGRRKRLVRSIVRDLRRLHLDHAAERIDATYGDVR